MKIRMVKANTPEDTYGVILSDEVIAIGSKKEVKDIYRSLTGRRGARDGKLLRFYDGTPHWRDDPL